MNLNKNKLWISDVDEILASSDLIEKLTGHSILITGATGLIGSSLTFLLLRYNELHNQHICIYAAGRNQEKFNNRFGSYLNHDYFTYVPYDATKTDNRLNFDCDYIIHGASNATPATISNQPTETMIGNIIGMKCLLDYAKEHHSKRVLYISSSEVYGKKTDNSAFREDEYGYVDLLNARNVYSVGKRATETLCAGYASEFGVDFVIARPGHIYGPTASIDDNRVSSQWAYSAAKQLPIIMKSDGAQIRSYCYCLDCASALLTILLKGESSHAYNISNRDSVITIKDMAQLLAVAGETELIIQNASEKEQRNFNPMPNSALNSDALYTLGWRGLFRAERGFSHTVSILKKSILK